MARWKLSCPHYLNCRDSEWEYSENNRTTGRPMRKKFPVPHYLDPRDPGDWTNKWGNADNSEGEIVVCWEGKGQDRDITFYGDPTPDMIPVDDEAAVISATFADRWRYKPDSAEISYSQALVDEFQTELADKMSKPVEIPGLQELVAAIATMATQNQEILKTIAAPARRII